MGAPATTPAFRLDMGGKEVDGVLARWALAGVPSGRWVCGTDTKTKNAGMEMNKCVLCCLLVYHFFHSSLSHSPSIQNHGRRG